MARVDVDLGVRTEEKAVEVSTDAPFRIAILGDFSGRAHRPAGEPLRSVQIDPANFREVMEQMNAALDLPAGALKFRSLDDFHPDQLYRALSLDSQGLREVLRDPNFQAMESVWRSVFFFFRYVTTGTRLHVHLIDIAYAELRAKIPELTVMLTDLAPRDPKWSLLVGLYTFAHSEAGCELLTRLGALARMAGAPFLSAADGCLFGCESIVATPDPEKWIAPKEAELVWWQRLRESQDASWIGLAFPRFLLRLPYGKTTSPIESFEFEEMPGTPLHEAYLWGNPAMACACLLGQEFNREGWEMRARSMARLDGVPLHIASNCQPTPPAEIWMSEECAARIAEAGVMPLASMRDSDAIQLVRFQSIADPPQPLAGPW